jgi:hypothetical protein
LLRQRIAEYSCVPIVLIGMVGLALDIGTREWTNDGTIVAEAFVERSPLTMDTKAEPEPSMQLSAPVAAEPFVERWPPTLKTQAEPKPTIQLAALDPDTRLLDESDRPASKGHIMYANSPTHWTPVPLPDDISSARAPHNNNIRAEIEQAAKLFDVDTRMMKAFAKIESGYNPKARTGKYNCLF